MFFADREDCPICDGTGQVEKEKVVGSYDSLGTHQSYWLYIDRCDDCDGTGQIEKED